MGLTLHYSLKHKGDEKSVRQRIEQLHQAAQDLPFKELGTLVDLKGKDCEFAHRDREDPLRWLLVQADGSLKLDQHSWMGVPPTRVIAFTTWPGDGCEAANFGLCQYPTTVEHQDRRLRTKLAGWSWSSFCKTQYASDPQCGGLGNFLRCHLSVIALLDKAKELGLLESVRDEAGFWDNRDVKALVPEIASWNQMIAAFVGQMKDGLGGSIEAPITEFRNFEELELAGQSQLPPQMQDLTELIKQVAKKS